MDDEILFIPDYDDEEFEEVEDPELRESVDLEFKTPAEIEELIEREEQSIAAHSYRLMSLMKLKERLESYEDPEFHGH